MTSGGDENRDELAADDLVATAIGDQPLPRHPQARHEIAIRREPPIPHEAPAPDRKSARDETLRRDQPAPRDGTPPRDALPRDETPPRDALPRDETPQRLDPPARTDAPLRPETSRDNGPSPDHWPSHDRGPAPDSATETRHDTPTDNSVSAPPPAAPERRRRTAAFPTHGLLIGGEWVESVSEHTFESRNPADHLDIIGRFQAGTAADVARAVRAAEAAFPGWRATPAPRRGEVLYRFGQLMAEHKERLARAMTREMGKVLIEARGDVQEAIDIAFLMAGEGRRSFGDTVPSELPDKWAMSIRQPIGVVGIITPWNFPMAIPCWKMMPALVTGNTVVFKPASDTPQCATLLMELMVEAGFPPGTVNLVTGSGSEVGDAIVDSPDVPVISFTGSSDTGRRIAERAARRLKRVSLELGGKNAIVVLADADLDLATDGILWSAFGTTGQRCTACSRVIVEEAVVEPLLRRLEERTRALRLGPGLDPSIDVGPLINQAAREKVERYIEIGRREGKLIVGGRRAIGMQHGADLDAGQFFEPTIFRNVKPMDRIAQEEIFGPVLAVISVPDYDAALVAMNQTRYGLSGAIYTRDVNTAFRAMRDFETGIVYVNAGTIGAETHLPFGGVKETGNGHREAGHAALDTYTEWKSIYVDFSGRLQRAQIDNQTSG